MCVASVNMDFIAAEFIIVGKIIILGKREMKNDVIN
jgi:hypothetical protein